MTDKIVIFSTCNSEEEGTRIARELVQRRLAACVTMLPGARSIYRWQGQVEESPECMLVIKSGRLLFPTLCEELAKMHSYSVPEIIALPIVDGSGAYLDWLARELQGGESS